MSTALQSDQYAIQEAQRIEQLSFSGVVKDALGNSKLRQKYAKRRFDKALKSGFSLTSSFRNPQISYLPDLDHSQ
jgi:hypothetical protein